jgi:hypothetical protein
METIITIRAMNWALLCKQKESLIDVLAVLGQNDLTTEDQVDHLRGILHMVDHVQDRAAEQLGEEVVFYTEPEKPDDTPPEGSAACPVCFSVYLDPTHAAACCEEMRA